MKLMVHLAAPPTTQDYRYINIIDRLRYICTLKSAYCFVSNTPSSIHVFTTWWPILVLKSWRTSIFCNCFHLKKKYYNNNDIINHKLSMPGCAQFFPGNFHIWNIVTPWALLRHSHTDVFIKKIMCSDPTRHSFPPWVWSIPPTPWEASPILPHSSPHPLKSLKLPTQTFPMRQRPQRHMEASSGQNAFWNTKMFPVLILRGDKNQTRCRSSPLFITLC